MEREWKNGKKVKKKMERKWRKVKIMIMVEQKISKSEEEYKVVYPQESNFLATFWPNV